jgi:hypothetical protein
MKKSLVKEFSILGRICDDKIRRIVTMPLLFLKQNLYYKGQFRWKIIAGARSNGVARAASAHECRPKTAEKPSAENAASGVRSIPSEQCSETSFFIDFTPT